MIDDNSYSIVDLEGYVNHIRESVAESFSDSSMEIPEDLNESITLAQVKDIVIGYSLGQDDNGDYLINEEAYNDMFDDIRSWMFGTSLAKLAAKDLIECAWDDTVNEMVFWISDNKTPPEQRRNHET